MRLATPDVTITYRIAQARGMTRQESQEFETVYVHQKDQDNYLPITRPETFSEKDMEYTVHAQVRLSQNTNSAIIREAHTRGATRIELEYAQVLPNKHIFLEGQRLTLLPTKQTALEVMAISLRTEIIEDNLGIIVERIRPT